MERKNASLIELDLYEKEILGMVVHAESFESILSEFSGSAYILGDCLRSLVRQKILRLFEYDEKSNSWRSRMIYDADKLREYRYQLTALGMQLMTLANEKK
ncbi:MAG: hypothetical protein LPK45_07005 [Bacteroidota bacterium]|nr:hypothetical protein [Bacteroidota bacterium]MDX5430824.1 hypothetical protein [Bacteroidota bacterium]MDX5469568.1 hypothetical protein [Bacteroidota bacterium]